MSRFDFDTKVEQISQAIEQLESKMGVVSPTKKPSCISFTIVLAVVLPILIFSVLSLLLRKKNKDGTYKKQLGKSFIWSSLISLLLWAILYCYSDKVNNFICWA